MLFTLDVLCRLDVASVCFVGCRAVLDADFALTTECMEDSE